MKLFFKRRVSNTPSWWEALDRTQQIYGHRLADWLGRKSAGIPTRRLRWWVMGCLLGLALLNVAGTMYSLRGHHRDQAFGWSAPVGVRPPRVGRRPRMERTLGEYLDSLRRDSVGSRLLDSLLRERPGLADTLERVMR